MKVLKSVILLVFTGKICLQEFQAPEASGKGWSKEELPLVEKDQAKEHLNKPNVPKPMGPGKIHPWAMRELADAIVRPLLMIFENSWGTQEAP